MARPVGHPDNITISTIGAHERWAREKDRSAATQPARQRLRDSFVTKARELFGDLPPAELERRAENLRKAHYSRMALRSAQARRAKRRGAQAGAA